MRPNRHQIQMTRADFGLDRKSDDNIQRIRIELNKVIDKATLPENRRDCLTLMAACEAVLYDRGIAL